MVFSVSIQVTIILSPRLFKNHSQVMSHLLSTTRLVWLQPVFKMSYRPIDPLLFLLPHHYQNSEQTLLNYEFETIRGHLKLMQGNQFKTTLSFNGLLPAMTLPKK